MSGSSGVVVLNQAPVELFDEDGNPVTITQSGNLYMVSVRDEEQLDYLRKIHIQLKKMNAYLSHMIDEDYDDHDIEEDD